MMQFNPRLIVKRVRVERNKEAVFDECFHLGVNIIRGQNSSGKSTILNFIFYGLGGDLYEWSDAAEKCDTIYVEVELNGLITSLKREITREAQRPMYIYGGDLNSGLRAPASEWARHLYSRGAILSFSQIIFNLMDIPEAASEATGKITIHQVMRLLYADQLTPVDNLFKYDGRWDTPVIRDAIGRLLCGGQETLIYENTLLLRAAEKDFSDLDAEQAAIFNAYKDTGSSLTVDWVAEQKKSLNREAAKIEIEITEIERRQLVGELGDPSYAEQMRAYEETSAALSTFVKSREEVDALSLSIEDLEAFGDGLADKIDSLRKSEIVAATVGAISFDACPVCLAAVSAEPHACNLCKTPTNVETSRARMSGLMNDIVIQKDQTEKVLAKKRTRLEEAKAKSLTAEIAWKKSARRLSSIQARPSVESQATLNSLVRQRGYLDRQIDELDRTSAVVRRVSEISKKKESLSGEISRLKSEMKAMEASQDSQLKHAKSSIAEIVKSLLVADLRRQDSFANPKVVDFDFAANRISVDDQTYFSASSRVILKTSFFVAFALAAANDKTFRHPRFCIIDTIEDKGMEQERSQNFQRLIVEKSEQSIAQHQIIFATAMIAPELDNSRYTVGRPYTRDDPTLDL